MASIHPGWSKPAAVLFASDRAVNEKAFGFALAEAAEFGANLILFHAYSTHFGEERRARPRGLEMSAARDEKQRFEAHAERARELGIHCRVVVRPGAAAEQIVAFLGERRIDRVVMGARTPGPIGKLLVGSVAEAVLRSAGVPVYIVGPEVVEGNYRHYVARSILCSLSAHESSRVVARFGAELAAKYNAGLILQQAILPQNCAEVLAGRTLAQVEEELFDLVPAALQGRIALRAQALLGDPVEELLLQGRALHASLIVMGAQGASHFAAVSRAGAVYKVLAYAQCPVITLSPAVLGECGGGDELAQPVEPCMAGVF